MTSIRTRAHYPQRYRRRARPKRATPIRFDHLASYWGSSARELRDAVLRSVAGLWTLGERRERKPVEPAPADVIGLTEVAAPHRARCLAGLARDVGFTVVQGPLQDRDGGPVVAEVALLLRDASWRYLGHEVVILGPDMGPGAEVIGLIVAAEHVETGARELFAETHMPAGVEAGWRALGRRVRVTIAAWARFQLRLAAWRRRIRPNGVLVAGDWNLDLGMKWVRTTVTAAWPRWTLPRFTAGAWTHAGRRLIDWCLARGIRGLVLTVLPAHPHSDHRGIRLRGRIPAWAKRARRA